jgi:dimethylamine monooxygenase subunit A
VTVASKRTDHGSTTRTEDRISRFPFPFPTDAYRYSTNVEPARTAVATAAGSWGEHVVDIDAEYEGELVERERILRADPQRHIVLPHMRMAAWDTMLTLMREMAASYPDVMSLTRTTAGWHWSNRPLGVEQDFVVGDDASLPVEPLGYIGGQVQEDLVLLDQREGTLFADAGLVTFAADWSLKFDIGMTFPEIHGPVPRVHQTGVIERAHQFLMRLQPGDAFRRTNWTMTVDRRLDTSTETYPEWGRDRRLVVDGGDLGERLHLRVEVQHLIRLAESGCVLFLIRTYLLSLEELVSVPAWAGRFAAVLAELPQDMADYKGLSRFRDAAAAWTAARTTP